MEKDWRVTVTLLVVSLFLNVILFASVIPGFFEPEVTGFSVVDTEIDVYTKEVCETQDGETVCNDELFVQCNGLEKKVDLEQT